MNNPFSKRGGIISILALFRTVLIQDQYVLRDVPGLAKVLPALRKKFRLASSISFEPPDIILCILLPFH